MALHTDTPTCALQKGMTGMYLRKTVVVAVPVEYEACWVNRLRAKVVPKK